MSVKKTLYKNSFKFGISNFLTKAIILFLLPLYVKTLSIEIFGVFNLFLIYYNILSIIMRFGVSTVFLNFFIDSKTLKEKRDVTGHSLSYLLFFNILIIIVCFIFSNKLSYLFIKQDYSLYIKLFTIVAFLEALSGFFISIFRANNKSFYYLIVSISYALTVFIISFVGHFFYNNKLLLYVIAILIAKIVLVILLLIFNIKYINIKINISFYKKLIIIATPLIFSNLALWIINMSDKLLINYFTNTIYMGIYTLSNKISSLIFLIIYTPFSLVWLPMAIKMFDSENRKEYFAEVFNQLLMMIILLGLFLNIFSQEIIIIIGNKDYLIGWFVIPILNTALLFYILSTYYQFYFIKREKTLYLTIIYSISAVINIVLNIFFINIFGFWGAALATLIAYMASFISIHYLVNRSFSINYNVKSILILMIVYIIASMSGYISFLHWYYKIPILILSYGIIFKTMALKKEFNKMLFFIKNFFIKSN